MEKSVLILKSGQFRMMRLDNLVCGPRDYKPFTILYLPDES